MMRKVWIVVVSISMLATANVTYGSSRIPIRGNELVTGRVKELTDEFVHMRGGNDADGVPKVCGLLVQLNEAAHMRDSRTRMQCVKDVVKQYLREVLKLPDHLEFLHKMVVDELMAYVNMGGWGRGEVELARTVWEWRRELVRNATVPITFADDKHAGPRIRKLEAYAELRGEQYNLETTNGWVWDRDEYSNKHQTERELQREYDITARNIWQVSGNSVTDLRPVTPFGEYTIGVAPTFMAWNEKKEPVRLVMDEGTNGGLRPDQHFDVQSGQDLPVVAEYDVIERVVCWIYHMDPALRSKVMNFVDADVRIIGKEAYKMIWTMQGIFKSIENDQAMDKLAYTGMLHKALTAYAEKEGIHEITESLKGNIGCQALMWVVEDRIHSWYDKILERDTQTMGAIEWARRNRETARPARGLGEEAWDGILSEEFVEMLSENKIIVADGVWRDYWRAILGIWECRDGGTNPGRWAEAIEEWKRQTNEMKKYLSSEIFGNYIQNDESNRLNVVRRVRYWKGRITGDLATALENMIERGVVDDRAGRWQIATKILRMTQDQAAIEAYLFGYNVAFRERTAILPHGRKNARTVGNGASRVIVPRMDHGSWFSVDAELEELPIQLLITQLRHYSDEEIPMSVVVAGGTGEERATYQLRAGMIGERGGSQGIISRNSDGGWRYTDGSTVRSITENEVKRRMNDVGDRCKDMLLAYIKMAE
jgi:hypothetical protein